MCFPLFSLINSCERSSVVCASSFCDRRPDRYCEMDPSSPATSIASSSAHCFLHDLPAGPMALLAPFSGVAENCSGFLAQCTLLFEMQSQCFTTDRAKVEFIISLLSGRALQWAKTIWEQAGPVSQTLNAFLTQFKEVYDQTATFLSVHDQLFHLKQGKSSVSEDAVFNPCRRKPME